MVLFFSSDNIRDIVIASLLGIPLCRTTSVHFVSDSKSHYLLEGVRGVLEVERVV